MLLAQLEAPGRERVAPAAHRVAVAGVARERNAAAPAIVVDERHRPFAPGLVIRGPIADGRTELVVTVAEDVGFDLQHVADDAFDRKAASVDLGGNPLD